MIFLYIHTQHTHHAFEIIIYNKPSIVYVAQYHISVLGSAIEILWSIQNKISIGHSGKYFWCIFFLEQLTVANFVYKFPVFVELESSSSH
jgi:hypothetical protein